MLLLEIVIPERLFLSERLPLVVVPGSEGDFGVTKEHAPFLSEMRAGAVCLFDKNGKVSQRYYVSGGFAEVIEGRCALLAESVYEEGSLLKESPEQALDALPSDTQDVLRALMRHPPYD